MPDLFRRLMLTSVAGGVLAAMPSVSAAARESGTAPRVGDAAACAATPKLPDTVGPAAPRTAVSGAQNPADQHGGATTSAPSELDHLEISNLCAEVGQSGEIDVTLQVRNLSDEPRTISSGALQVFVEDVDGLSVMNDVPLEPEGNATTSFEPELSPKGEVRIRYRIMPFEGSAPLRRLNVREFAEGAVASYDVSALRSPVTTSAGAASIGSSGFVPLRDFDVRIDRLVALRNGQTELFYTLRNTTRAAIATNGEHVVFKATGAGGGLVDNIYQFFPARGDRRPSRPPTAAHLEPGATVQLRTYFERPVKGPVVATDGRTEHRVPLPEQPRSVR